MKRVIISLFVFLLSSNAFAFIPEIKTIPLNDGEVIEARLCLPDNKVKTIVFCIAGTGPTTYLTKRTTFNYFESLQTAFVKKERHFYL